MFGQGRPWPFMDYRKDSVMIEHSETGTTVTGEHIMVYRTLAVRRALILKIDTGLTLTRISPLTVAQRDGITTKRTCRGALKDVNQWLADRGLTPAWSKKHPQG